MLSNFLHAASTTKGLVHPNDASESYEVYKYSLIASGYILRGLLTLTFGQEQITTTERYRIQSEVVKERGLGDEDMVFEREGFLFKRADNLFLMISHRVGSPSEVQTAYLSSLSMNRVLRGSFSDRHSDLFYAARIYMNYISALPSADRICAVKPDAIPDNVNEYLTRELDHGIYIINLN
jgi:hypothetical protein